MITCFSDHVILGKALHQCSENPLRIMLRPFGTASERLEGNIKTFSKLWNSVKNPVCSRKYHNREYIAPNAI